MIKRVRLSTLVLALLLPYLINCSEEVADPGISLAPVIRQLLVTGSVVDSSSGSKGIVAIANSVGRTLEFGLVTFACATTLNLYSTTGELVWDQARDTPPRPGGCKWLPSEVVLRSGQSVSVATEVASDSLLRAKLAPGTYGATINVIFARMVPHPELAGALTSKVDTIVRVNAGTLLLQ
jgi:hypothetical protein